ncbi:AsmA family protein [Xanthobacter sp. TB0139]|uniref:AsmA family protein n=1 Tax=Xanthobacter sp. TB0139 TaxID=3459178 RepID=UPI004039E21F
MLRSDDMLTGAKRPGLRQFMRAALVLCGLGALLLLCAIALVPLMVSGGQMRLAAQKALAGNDHFQVEIANEPQLQMLPTPRVVVKGVHIALTDQQTISARQVVSRLDPWRLLFGRIEVADITLENPTLLIETGQDMVDIIPSFLAHAPGLRIVDGTVALRSRTGNIRPLIRHLDGRVDRATGKGVALTTRFSWHDGVVDSSLTIDDVSAFLAGQSSDTRLRVATKGGILRFRGQAGFDSSLSAGGDITVDVDSLRKMVEWMGAQTPFHNGLGPFSLAGQLKMKKGEIALTGARVSLDGNRMEGGFLVDLSQNRPRIQGTFASEELNLHPYDALHLTVNGGREWSPAPLNLTILNAFDLDLRFSAGQISIGAAPFTTVAGSAVLSDGELVLAIGQATGWGGTLRGTATISTQWDDARQNQRGASVRMEAECTSIALEQGLGEMAGLRQFEGPGTLSFSIRGSGLSVRNIAHDLSGTLSLTSNGGYLRGFDVARMLRRIETRPLSASAGPQGGRTSYIDLDAQASISHGVATLSHMELRGQEVRLNMAGLIGISSRMLNLKGIAALVPEKSGQLAEDEDIELPFMVQGSWTSPRVMADPLSLIERSGAAQPLLEAFKTLREQSRVRPAVQPAADTLPTAPPLSAPPATVH